MSMLKRFLLLVVLLHAPVALAARTVLVMGDSLSAGYGMAASAGWVSLLEQRLQRDAPDWRVINASISGETSSGGRSRLPAALAEHRPAVVIIELGGNDGLRGLPVSTLRDNLDAMIRESRRQGARVVLVGMQLPPNYGKAYTEKFRAVYAELASRHRVALVPFLLEGIAEKADLFQADRIHPLPQAQPAILANVWPVLKPLLKG